MAGWTRRGLPALALVAAAAGCGSSAPHFQGRSDAGVHYDCLTDSPDRRAVVFDRLAEAHVGWVRINVNWRGLEPVSRGDWDPEVLDALDDCIDKAVAHGIRPDLTLTGDPEWAKSGADFRSPPSNLADYAAAIGFLAKRYRGRVRAWEIWNEENTTRFWTGTAADYTTLLRAAYPAVKAADPDALVVFGSTLGNDTKWIQAAYAAGAKGFFDVMATHPYPPDHLSTVAAVRAAMDENGDGRKPIWFTEIGWAAPLRMTLTEQARRLTDLFAYARKDLPYVKVVIWFQALAASPGASPWEHDLELLNDDLSPRPAYETLKRLAG